MRRIAAIFLALLLPATVSAEPPTPLEAAKLESSRLSGMWKVVSVRGLEELSSGDLVGFSDEGVLVTYFAKPDGERTELRQDFRIEGRRLKVPSGNIDVDYHVVGEQLRLTTPDGFVDVILSRAGRVIVG